MPTCSSFGMVTNVRVSVADPVFSTRFPQTPVAKPAPRPTQLGPRPFSDFTARLVKQPPTPSWTLQLPRETTAS